MAREVCLIHAAPIVCRPGYLSQTWLKKHAKSGFHAFLFPVSPVLTSISIGLGRASLRSDLFSQGSYSYLQEGFRTLKVGFRRGLRPMDDTADVWMAASRSVP